MASDDIQDEFDGDGLRPRRGMSGKKLVVIAGMPMLLAGTAAGAYYSGALSPGGGDHYRAEAQAEEGHTPVSLKSVFYDLPEMIVNLNTSDRRPSFLKIQVSLELADEGAIAAIEKVRPRVIDNFQVYLRELRVDDLRGSAGIYRLREELLARVNATVAPARVKDVLFREVLVQ